MGLSCYAGSFALSTAAATNTQDVTNAAMAGIDASAKVAILFFWNGRTTAGQAEQDSMFGMGYAVSATDRGGATSQSDHSPTTSATDSQAFNDACVKTLTITGTVDGAMDFSAVIANGFRLVIDDAFPAAYLVGFIAIWGSDLLDAASVTVTEPGATGNQDTTTVGFQPDAALFFGAADAALNTSTGQSAFSVGAAAGASPANATMGGAAQDAQATSNTWSYSKTGECVGWMGGAADTVASRASLTAWLSNGFTLNWAEVSATAAPVFRVLCLRGVSAAVFNGTTATNTTNFSVSSFGFTPVGIMVASHNKAASTADTTQPTDERTVGFATGATQRVSCGILDKDASALMDVGAAFHTDELYSNQSTATTIAIEGLMDLVSFDADGATFVMDDADPTNNFFWGIAFGAAPVVGGGQPTALRGLCVPGMRQHAPRFGH